MLDTSWLRRTGTLAVLTMAAGCTGTVAGSGNGNGNGESKPEACTGLQVVAQLPAELVEASGIARDPRDDELFWLHNDSGNDAVLYAVGTDGELRGSVPITDATSQDPEDLALAECGGEWCLFYADMGDNSAVREDVYVHRLPLPALPAPGQVFGDPVSPLATYWIRYPGGPRDAESLIVDSERGELIVVTKGREGFVELYVGDLETLETADGPVVLDRAGRLNVPIDESGRNTSLLITAGDLAPDGARLAIRSYAEIHLFDWAGSAAFDTLAAPESYLVVSASEPQGEGLAFAGDGETVYLASEARNGNPPQLTRLTCRP
jgi:hypothetical protein